MPSPTVAKETMVRTVPSLHESILRTLLYYDIWKYPLSEKELYWFLPINTVSLDDFREFLRKKGPGANVREHEGYYFMRTRSPDVVGTRREMERNAKKLWQMARFSMHCIKRFPFVRAVFVSGDLSKNATRDDSDIDFFIIAATGRVWICRSFLILFKKIFLLNKKKYFCLNYFASETKLRLEEQSLFTATEIAHLKPLFGDHLFHRYMEENSWIREFFPNLRYEHLPLPTISTRRSILQVILELPFRFLPADSLDEYLMNKMRSIWLKRYPDVRPEIRDRIFRSTRQESRAYVGNFEDRILQLYDKKVREYIA